MRKVKRLAARRSSLLIALVLSKKNNKADKRLFRSSLALCFAVLTVFNFAAASEKPPRFQPAVSHFPVENERRRKWEGPIVADVDRDGWPDLLLNDHGYGISIAWNNQGKYTAPERFIVGDMHGLSVADYDKDGLIEVIIARGGGSGSDLRNAVIVEFNRTRQYTQEQDNPLLIAMRGRTLKFIDVNHDGELDLINFAYPSIAKRKKQESENYLYQNTPTRTPSLTLHSTIARSYVDGQKTLIADLNNDGNDDLILYGHRHLRVFTGDGNFTFDETTEQVINQKIEDVTSAIAVDYDNDGDLDLFLSRGNELQAGETFYDPSTQYWGFYSKRGPFNFSPLPVGDVLTLENYQTPYGEKVIHIGEAAYTYEPKPVSQPKQQGDWHMGRNLRFVNSDSLGFSDNVKERGLYIGFIGNRNWQLSGNTFAPISGVVHGVHHYPAYNHHPGLTDILLENQAGKFVDVSQTAGFHTPSHSMNAVSADFDNNGYNDLLVVQRGTLVSANHALLYLNRGDGSFSLQMQHGVVTHELGAIGLGASVVDYNQDGLVDIALGNERGLWHLFTNDGGPTPLAHLNIAVFASASGASALGAKVSVEACGNTQFKTVGNDSLPYSRSFNHIQHFGLGNCNKAINVTVTWPNGDTQSKRIKSKHKLTIGFGSEI